MGKDNSTDTGLQIPLGACPRSVRSSPCERGAAASSLSEVPPRLFDPNSPDSCKNGSFGIAQFAQNRHRVLLECPFLTESRTIRDGCCLRNSKTGPSRPPHTSVKPMDWKDLLRFLSLVSSLLSGLMGLTRVLRQAFEILRSKTPCKSSGIPETGQDYEPGRPPTAPIPPPDSSGAPPQGR